MEEPKPKRKPGRPRKTAIAVPLPPVVEAVMPVVEVSIDDIPPLEEAPESPARPSTPELPPFEHYQPPEPPLRWPNHLSVGELRIEITKYATICGGRMRQLIDEWDRRFPLRR